MSTIRLAVIGSRETPHEVMREMFTECLKITRHFLSLGHNVVWVSGGCWKGPDQIQFALARFKESRSTEFANVDFICYLPDEKKLKFLPKLNPQVTFRVIGDTEEKQEILKGLVGHYDRLKDYAKLLHGRNLHIIAGDTLSEPVDYVYYYAPLSKSGAVTGGTAVGVAYAKLRMVRCIHHEFELRDWYKELKDACKTKLT
ncbi:MAG: hypothetical protein ACRDBQ_18790 [Shewanella sp.]